MQFFVINWREVRPQRDDYPYIVLEKDSWDDFGYQTLFRATICLGRNETVDLREVKIYKRGVATTSGHIAAEFERLDESYCSLGQELAYYESLLELPEQIRAEYLIALRDVVADPNILAHFEKEDGFVTSLLRWGPAERALEDGPFIMEGIDETSQELEFTFITKFGANEFATKLRYCNVEKLPGRINAIIGYNGTGKTRLLANLAWVARAELHSRRRDDIIERYGYIQPDGIRFGAVVAISYSAFDTFELPWDSDHGSQFGYTYCGLRRQSEQGAKTGLKDVEEIAGEIEQAIARINTPARRNTLKDALKPLQDEPSFARAGYMVDLLADGGQWRDEFDMLSTGHKTSINIIVQLVGALQHRSLVLIDEPESHLHPPLLAALMKGIGIALRAHRSYAVIATHSPVVLQEIAGCYAHVLQRYGTINKMIDPQIETFGENIGLLTSHVFNLDNTASDYIGILRDLASQRSLPEIDQIFERGLSSQARALVMQMRMG